MMANGFERLMAYADGELDEAGRREVETMLAADPSLRAQLDEQRRLRAALGGHYSPLAEEPVPERFRTLLGADADEKRPHNIVDFGAARRRRGGLGLPAWGQLTAIAATLVVGILAGQLLPLGSTAPVSIADGRMIAQGPLAEALETRLASAQAADAETRIGVSFASEDGRLCRTFDSAAMAGLACRGGADWELMMIVENTPGQAGAYRQAGSGPALVMELAQGMMADAPLDAGAERRARAEGWRPPARD